MGGQRQIVAEPMARGEQERERQERKKRYQRSRASGNSEGAGGPGWRSAAFVGFESTGGWP